MSHTTLFLLLEILPDNISCWGKVPMNLVPGMIYTVPGNHRKRASNAKPLHKNVHATKGRALVFLSVPP